MRPLVATAALVAGWPAASQAAASLGRADLMPWITAGAIALVAVLATRRAAARPRALALAGAVAVVALAALAPAAILYAPPVAIDLALAGVFAQSLRPGREPMISRFARRERGGVLEADIAAYTRTLTVAWVVLFLAMAVAAALLAIAGPLAAWSLFCNVISYALVAALLVGEYAYRRVRFRHYRHASLGAFLRAVAAGLPRASAE